VLAKGLNAKGFRRAIRRKWKPWSGSDLSFSPPFTSVDIWRHWPMLEAD